MILASHADRIPLCLQGDGGQDNVGFGRNRVVRN
jgi:hypothetical protein